MNHLRPILISCVFILNTSVALAAPISISIDFQPVTGVSTAATGSLTGNLDDVTGLLNFTIEYSGLTLNNTGMVFHGPVDALLNGSTPVVDSHGNPLPDETDNAAGRQGFGPIASGASGQFTVSGGTSQIPNLNPAFIANLGLTEIDDVLLGFWYVDLHSVAFPGGELRGHIMAEGIAPVPLPAAAWLFLSAVGGLCWFCQLVDSKINEVAT